MYRNNFIGGPRRRLGQAPVAQTGPDAFISRHDEDEEPGFHFHYGPPPTTLQANGSTEISYQVTNHDHDAYYLTAQSTGAFTCTIKVGDRLMSNIPIHSANLFGQGGSPMPLLVPLRTRKNDIIYFDITDISGQQNTIYITLTGVEVDRD